MHRLQLRPTRPHRPSSPYLPIRRGSGTPVRRCSPRIASSSSISRAALGALKRSAASRWRFRPAKRSACSVPTVRARRRRYPCSPPCCTPTRGDVLVFGASAVSNPAEVRRRVGLAPQQISLYPTLTGQENLEFFGKLHGLAVAVRRQRVEQMLELVGLAPRRDDAVHTYSGGMQRRLNLACSLIHEPRLLLLDEPTAGVDPQSRENLFEVIRQIASAGTTIVYTTHYIEEAERLCDRIAILDEGRIAAVGTLQELLGLIGMGEVIEIRGAAIASGSSSLEALPDVVKVERDDGVVRLFVKSAARSLALIAGVAARIRRRNRVVGGVPGQPGARVHAPDRQGVARLRCRCVVPCSSWCSCWRRHSAAPRPRKTRSRRSGRPSMRRSRSCEPAAHATRSSFPCVPSRGTSSTREPWDGARSETCSPRSRRSSRRSSSICSIR